MKKFIFAILILTTSQAALAQYMFSPSVSYLDRELNDNSNPAASSNLSIIDMKLGYIFDMGLYIGALYSLIDDEITSDSSDFHFGPSIGYYNSGFFVSGTFYIFGERDLAAGNTKYADVSGFQLDFAYAVPINKTLSIGPQITYHKVKYSDAQVSGLSSPTSYEWKGITPYAALFVNF